MKKNILRVLVLGVLIVGTINKVFANDANEEMDLYTGPGAGMLETEWNYLNGRIFAAGVGPLADYEDPNANKALEYQSPKTIEYNIANPIDNSLIDMGPTSGEGVYRSYKKNTKVDTKS